MQNETRVQFNQYLERLSELNHTSVNSVFNVQPSVQQKLEQRIQESSDFLKKVNFVGVRELSGEKIGLGVSSPIASTTDTTTKAREPRDVVALDSRQYTCTKTNFDTLITYSQLDMWAKFPDFQTKIRDAIIKRQALDRIMIAWNGKTRADNSDRVTNPLLEDVAVGWLERYRLDSPQRVMKEVASGSNKVEVGANVTTAKGYKNLDALVFDAVNSLIDSWHQDSTELVTICGRELLSEKMFPLLNESKATERVAGKMLASSLTLGNLPVVRVPYFPKNSLFITSLSNLSIYYQDGSRRRHLKDVPERDRIENYESSNDAYVIEDYGFGCLIENIELKD